LYGFPGQLAKSGFLPQEELQLGGYDASMGEENIIKRKKTKDIILNALFKICLFITIIYIINS